MKTGSAKTSPVKKISLLPEVAGEDLGLRPAKESVEDLVYLRRLTTDVTQEEIQDQRFLPEVRTRIESALFHAKDDDLISITMHIPRSLTEYVDRYVDRLNHIDPRRKYRKQDAGFEMFTRFYGEHLLPPLDGEDSL